MSFKKILIYATVFIFILFFLGCVPKKQVEGVPGLFIKDEVEIYKQAKGIDIIETLTNNWQEVSVLNKDEPVLELINNNRVKKWYNISYKTKDGSSTGWINEENIVLKESEPVEGVVFYKAKVYKEPDSRLTPLKTLAITEKVTLLGYEHSDGNRKFKFIIYENKKKGWAVNTKWIIPDGKIAVAFKELNLYSGMLDVEDYLIKDTVLNEFDIVAVLPEQNKDFVAISLPKYPKQEKYYVKKGGLSYNQDDVLLSIKLNTDYHKRKGYPDFIESKRIINVIQEATQSEDVIEYLNDNIKDIDNAIDKIDSVKLELTGILNEYNSRTPLVSFINSYIKASDNAISDLEEFVMLME